MADTVLGVDTSVVEAVAAVIAQLVTVGPAIIKGVEDAMPFAEVIVQTVMGGNVTPEQRKAVEDQITAMSNTLQAP